MAEVRSPGYPGIPLSEAIDLVGKIHAANRTNPIGREAAARDMGYSGLTGRSAKLLSDLSHFGLIEKAGSGHIRVSRRAVEILYPESQETRLGALHEAADAPTLFAQLNETFPDGLPSENALKAYLMRNSFASAAVQPIVSGYMQTYRWLEQQNVSVGHGPEPKNHEESIQSKFDPPQGTPLHTATAVSEGRKSRELPLMDGERVIFVEEANAGRYLKLVAIGTLDDSLLEALEDFTKRQRKRLAAQKDSPVEKAEAESDEDASGEVH